MTEMPGDAPNHSAGGPQDDSPGVITIPPVIYLAFWRSALRLISSFRLPFCRTPYNTRSAS